jgi:transglutaminase-like putative cysteine protease
MKLQVRCHLDYTFAHPGDVLLQAEAAIIPEQFVEDAHIALGATEHFARVAGQDGIGERIWLRVADRLTVDYNASVTINRLCGDWSALPATPPHMLPGETVTYLLPSRYCPSDRFEALVEAEFAGLSGGALVKSVHDWIAGSLRYEAGSSTAATGALETYVERRGVCRDFAHLMIALVRAAAIPARFASVYAPDVSPPDFHAVAEVFLDGTWYLIDPTGMAHPAEMAKIGIGRDAADVSFLTSYGETTLKAQWVDVQRA